MSTSDPELLIPTSHSGINGLFSLQLGWIFFFPTFSVHSSSGEVNDLTVMLRYGVVLLYHSLTCLGDFIFSLSNLGCVIE